MKTLWYCEPGAYPLADLASSGAAAWIVFKSVHGQGQPERTVVEWLPGAGFSEPATTIDRGLIGRVDISAFAVAEREGVLRPFGGVRWGYDASPQSGVRPMALTAATRYEWQGLLLRAKGQIPRDVLKRLPNAVAPL